MSSDLTAAFLRWSLARAALARGWWLVTAVYLVVVADLSPAQLVLVGVFQGVTVVVAEVPAGVLSDALSRRLALVVGHVVMGTGMAATGLVTSYPLLVATQCLWGLGWALSSGADVAWITDELDRPDLIDRVLVAQGRHQLAGVPVGIVGAGALAWAADLATAIVVTGVAMVVLGLVTVARWPEVRFRPAAPGRRWRRSMVVLRRGVGLARADRVVLLVLASTVLLHGGAEGFGRLFERRMVLQGLPGTAEPIVWFSLLALVAAALGAVAMAGVEARVAGEGVARRLYVAACAVGAVGLVLFAHAPDLPSAVAGALLVAGIGLPTTRVLATVLVNRRATGEVRATVHSLLSQAENLGEVACGLALAALAAAASSTVALTASGVLLALAGLVVVLIRQPAYRARDRTAEPGAPDPIFAAPRLAEIYDLVDDDRSDLDTYVALVDELGARSVVDVGCGTGELACRLARRGLEVTGVDPAGASLAVARRKPGAERVRWVEGDASRTPPGDADLVTMTGNVAQVFTTDAAWADALRRCRDALRPGGHLVFEVRDPARRAWERWTPGATRRTIRAPDGEVTTWTEVTDVALPLVSFRHTFAFASDGAVVRSHSTLRFRQRDEVLASVRWAGLEVVDVRGAPDRPGLEWVVLARRAGASATT